MFQSLASEMVESVICMMVVQMLIAMRLPAGVIVSAAALTNSAPQSVLSELNLPATMTQAGRESPARDLTDPIVAVSELTVAHRALGALLAGHQCSSSRHLRSLQLNSNHGRNPVSVLPTGVRSSRNL